MKTDCFQEQCNPFFSILPTVKPLVMTVLGIKKAPCNSKGLRMYSCTLKSTYLRRRLAVTPARPSSAKAPGAGSALPPISVHVLPDASLP